MHKIGDRVLAKNEYGWSNGTIVGLMTDACTGNIVTYSVAFDGRCTTYNIPECCVKNNIEEQLKKSDLKTGMHLTFKDGTSTILLKDTAYGDILAKTTDGHYFKFDNWDENLIHSHNSNHNIREVWNGEIPSSCILGKKARWDFLAEIDNPIEVTMRDIEKKFGHKIKIISQ